MKQRLFCIDVDGTLINSDHEIGPRTLSAVRRARQMGHLVTLVTGRRYVSTRRYVHQLNLDIPVICFNGGLIVDPETEEALHSNPVPRKMAADIVRAWTSLHAPVFVYRHSAPPDGFYENPNDHPWIVDYLKFEGENLRRVDGLASFLDWSPLRVMTCGHRQLTDRCFRRHEELWDDRRIRTLLSTDYSGARFLEVYADGTTKGGALRWLSERFGIPRERIVAFGDKMNDYDMLQWAGLGVAMGNALPQLKEVADAVTSDRDEAGVALVMEEILGCGGT